MSIFTERKTGTTANFGNQPGQPVGYALGSIEGRAAIQYVTPANPKDNFTFKCHRSNGSGGNQQDIYAVSGLHFFLTISICVE